MRENLLRIFREPQQNSLRITKGIRRVSTEIKENLNHNQRESKQKLGIISICSTNRYNWESLQKSERISIETKENLNRNQRKSQQKSEYLSDQTQGWTQNQSSPHPIWERLRHASGRDYDQDPPALSLPCPDPLILQGYPSRLISRQRPFLRPQLPPRPCPHIDFSTVHCLLLARRAPLPRSGRDFGIEWILRNWFCSCRCRRSTFVTAPRPAPRTDTVRAESPTVTNRLRNIQTDWLRYWWRRIVAYFSYHVVLWAAEFF